MTELHTRWGSRLSFIFAASAAAIGLGNIWRFPYMVGQHGGGIFVITYLICVIILGIPLVIAEIILGRLGRRNPVRSLARVAKASLRSQKWSWLGGLTVLAGFLIVSYYVVIVGWVLDYIVRSLTDGLVHASEATSLNAFKNLQHSHWQMLMATTLVVVSAMAINIMGIKKGLERAVLIMFPALFILLLLLLGYGATTSGFHEAVRYLFMPNFNNLTHNTILFALGQAFFSLNIAMGITVMFSAYLPEETPIISSAIAITIADTGFAILAGLVIFPIVFTYHLKAGAGPSLIFQTLPIAFGRMPAGSLIATLFFLMLFFAAFSSVIALLEPAISWLIETWHFSRTQAVLTTGFSCWLLSLLTIGSFSAPAHFSLFGMTFFDMIDQLTASIMLPVGGILTALFCGWLMKKQWVLEELNWQQSKWYSVWQWLLRYFAPVVIIFILLTSFNLI